MKILIAGEHEKNFQEIASSLCDTFSAKYVLYTLERHDHTNRITHSTHKEWAERYPLEFAEHCHLFEMVRTAVDKRNLPSACFPWAYVSLMRKDHKYTEDCRRDYGICNGISGGSRFSHFIEAFSIGGNEGEDDFFQKILKVQPYIQSYKLKFREIVLSEMVTRLWEDPKVLQYAMSDHINTPIIGEYQQKRSYFL